MPPRPTPRLPRPRLPTGLRRPLATLALTAVLLAAYVALTAG